MNAATEASATRAAVTLTAYDLGEGIAVEVELLGPGAGGYTRLVEGRIVDATDAVLVLEAKSGRRRTRIPWHAIAIIRTALDHPANY